MDIDVDYDYAHKDEVVAFEADDNGRDHFAKICTFTGMNAKSVLKDCCRINGLPTSTGSELAAFIPDEVEMTLQKAYDSVPELQDYLKNADDVIKKIWKIALKLEGTKKSQSTHACGHIPTPIPCEDLFPSVIDKKSGCLACQYDMAQAEHLGNLKKDLLMLRNLTIVDVAQREVKKKDPNIVIPIWNNEVFYDEEALKMISRGETLGIFQLESDGMAAFMKQLKPDTFEDIIAGVALYRPDPMDFIPQYIAGKKDPSTITYLTPKLEPILKNTYGVIVYQEQVMQIVQQLAGYTKGRSDVLRKAMGKKKMDIMLAERKVFIDGNQAEIDEAREKGKKEPPFVPGCVANGIPAEIADTIYDQMVDFAKYAFNKSHAACYAAIAMETAYIKAHYPMEYMAGLLSSVMDDKDKFPPYYTECRKLGVKVAKPDINESDFMFSVYGDGLRFGLARLKGITPEKMKAIIAEREAHGRFTGIADFVMRCPDVKKDNIEALIKAGAFDFTGKTRNAMLQSYESLINKIKKDSREQCTGQMTIFDMLPEMGSNSSMYDIPDAPELTAEEIREGEKEVTGLYLSSSPLDDYRSFVDKNTDSDSANLAERTKEPAIFSAGVITKKKLIHTKKTGALMCFYEIEDDYGKYTVVVFPKKYEELNCRNIGEGAVVWITGKAVDEDGKLEVLAEDLKVIRDIPVEYVLRTSPDRISEAERAIGGLPQGEAKVTLYVLGEGKANVKYYRPIELSNSTTETLKSKLGDSNVIVRRVQQMTHSFVTGENKR